MGMTLVTKYATVKEDYYIFVVNVAAKGVSFKSGCVVQVAKYLKEDWFVVLR